MAPVLAYWDVRGLVAPIQYLLEHVGEKYEYKKYEQEKAQEWFDDKEEVGMEFPNLPYYIDGNTKLSQSWAIIRHLGRKHNLVAKSEKDVEVQEVVDGVIADLIVGFAFLCYGSKDFENDKVKYRDERLAPVLQQLEKVLGSRKYAVGNSLTYSDFVLFERLDLITIMFPDVLNEYPNLKKYHQSIANLKGVKEFRESSRFPKALNGASAVWGGKTSEPGYY